MRSDDEVQEATSELCDRVWYYRKIVWAANERDGEFHPLSIPGMAKCEETYLDLSREMYMEDFDWGFLQGKLSALRWALGDDWDMLDT